MRKILTIIFLTILFSCNNQDSINREKLQTDLASSSNYDSLYIREKKTEINNLIYKNNLKAIDSIYNSCDSLIREEIFSEALCQSAHFKNFEISKLLLDKGINVNQRDYANNTPLINANGNFKLVQLLVQNGADINAKGHRNMGVLNGELQTVKFLVEHGADINQPGFDGITPIQNAVRNDNLEVVEYLISKDIDLNKSGSFGQTPLFIATKNSNLDMMELLLKNGADINIRSFVDDDDYQYSFSPFDIGFHKAEIINLLLKYGGDINIKDDNGFNAAIYAAQTGDLNSLKFLESKGAILDTAHAIQAAKYCKTKILKYLIDKEKIKKDNYYLLKQNLHDIIVVNFYFPLKDSSRFEMLKLLISIGVDIYDKKIDNLISKTYQEKFPLTYEVLVSNGYKKNKYVQLLTACDTAFCPSLG